MVYWTRRIAILLVVVALVVGAWWGIGALRGGGGDNAAEPNSPGASASASEASEEGAEPTEGASPEPESTEAAKPVECPNSVILVEATTDASTYPVESTPKFTLTITNTGDLACRRDVGPKANELEITSGGFHVWSSDDCNASNKSKVVTLQPGDKAASSITWDGRLSQKGCPDEEGDLAKAGRYDLVGRNGKVTSDRTPFALTSQG